MHPSASLLAALALGAPLLSQTSPYNTTLLASLKGTKVAFAGVIGYTAPDGREYAIVGERTSTWIVDCTIPTAPVEVASFAGPSSSWREMAGYKTYIYSGSENQIGRAHV